MGKPDIVRAWKDESYRRGLSHTELAQLPANPAGSIELSDEFLDSIAGGFQEAISKPAYTYGCCDGGDGTAPTHPLFTLGCCTASHFVQCEPLAQ